MPTKIEWAMESWNPVTGCSPVSIGCQNCYAKRFAKRMAGRFGYPKDDPFQITFHPDKLNKPLHWRKPRMVFVCSMGDLFHEDVPTDFIRKVFDIMAACPQHIFQVLTKRPQNIPSWFWQYIEYYRDRSNIWLGVTAENQETADERIPELLKIPAAVRFVSCEPLLGSIDLTPYLKDLDWVIVGGETGPEWRYSETDFWKIEETRLKSQWFDWARDIRDQCERAKVPFFFKKPPGGGKVMADGFTANTPDDLKIRQYPKEVEQ